MKLSILTLSFVFLFITGCSDTQTGETETYILKSSAGTVMPSDFKKAFETVQIAYADANDTDPSEMKKAKLRLVNQMAEELVIAQYAHEKGIVVTDAELEAAISRIKEDYPEGVFEQTLIENAITFSTWKNNMKKRLLMEKVTSLELVKKTELTADEIKAYYEQYLKLAEKEAKDKHLKPDEIKRLIVDRLRREKAEAAYETWISGLRDKYKVEINHEQLEKLISD